MKIRIISVPDGSAKEVYRRALVGLIVEARGVVDARPPKPNTNGRAYEVESDTLAQALHEAGKAAAAKYYGNVNPFPAMQWIGILIPTAAAEAV